MEQDMMSEQNPVVYVRTEFKRRISAHRLTKYLRLLLILPSLALVVLFSYYPAIESIMGSFTAWNGFTPPSFVGFQNFSDYFKDPIFFTEIKNISILVIGGVFTTVVFPFIGAELVLSLPEGRFQNAVKYLFVIPMVIPQVVLIDIWANLLNPNTGLVDAFLGLIHLPIVQWFSSSHTALISILLIGFPWISHLSFLIFLAGLQGIGQDIKDASKLDGCTGVRRVLRIDLPLILAQIQFVVVVAGVGIVQNFIPILLLTQGGPGNATMVPGLDMYNQAFQNNQLGYGMAIGTFLFVGMLIVSMIVLRFLKPRT
ncbi:sugar ABC transporter permease [Fodinisporobacter ferrooxydans]|uniref:Sugar ABC transporter permease n=1 Tax=Fodinisporobacter ferrooxydans TaxID=2901836 RepID=A0ABY4CKD0_9BACL|nr:sugar ABC transporter permease [Alicyclobacillaceae bacterium MYW30-H2]